MTMFRDSVAYAEYSADDTAVAPRKRTAKAAPPVAAISPLKLVDKTDAELIEMVKDGTRGAFDVLVSRHQQMVTSILLRMMDLSDAQDVAQEAFIKAYRSIESFRGDSQFATWLYRIATNTAMNHLKGRKRRPAALHLDALDSDKSMHSVSMVDHSSPEAFVIAEELQSLLKKRLNKLKPDLREAIVSYEIDGLSYQEIADNMECPVGTIRSRISRSREIIDNDLRAHGYDPLSQEHGGREDGALLQ